MTPTARPQVMNRPLKRVVHEASQQRGTELVHALSSMKGANPSRFDDMLQDLVVPHRRTERWKYSPIAGVWSTYETPKLTTAAEAGCEPCPVPGLFAYRFVFVNGAFDPAASDLPVHDGGVFEPHSLSSLQELELDTDDPTQSDWFAALNGKFATAGVRIQINPQVKLDRPILIHHHTSGVGAANFLSHSIEVGEQANVQLIHWSTADSEATGMVNVMTRIHVGKGAQVTLDKVQDEEGSVHHFAFESIEQLQASSMNVHTATVRGKWVRNDMMFRLKGQGADAVLNGVYLPSGSEFVDNHTTVDHCEAHCTSSENYKGILYDKSQGVFNGKVFVRPDAQQTNAYQQNANILASDHAQMNAKPELEIYADDVKCSHGCTIGQFDDEAMFYARSRGIGLEEARSMLVHAFIGEVLEGFAISEVKMEVEHRLSEKHGWMMWSDSPIDA